MLDIDDVPRVGSIEVGRRRPCVAVLSAAQYGARGDLEMRGLTVSEDALARIRDCTQLETLERWAARAREVTAMSELFSDA